MITGYYYDSLIFAHVDAGSCGCVCTVWTVREITEHNSIDAQFNKTSIKQADRDGEPQRQRQELLRNISTQQTRRRRRHDQPPLPPSPTPSSFTPPDPFIPPSLPPIFQYHYATTVVIVIVLKLNLALLLFALSHPSSRYSEERLREPRRLRPKGRTLISIIRDRGRGASGG